MDTYLIKTIKCNAQLYKDVVMECNQTFVLYVEFYRDLNFGM